MKQTICCFLLGIAVIWLTSPALAQDAPRQIVREAAGPRRWALLIGVNDYAELENLRYCGRDMQALAEKLQAVGFPQDQVFLLHSGAGAARDLPLKSNIEKQIDLVLSLVEKDDLLLVAFAGHGMFADGESYLCPSGARLDDPARTMVSLGGVYEKLKACNAALKLFVADACRNDPRPRGRRAADPVADAKELAQQFQRPPEGVLVLASCSEGQVSWEDEEAEHGVFTHYLLRGLSGEADGNGNGKVSLGELYEFCNLSTKKHVARKWRDYQSPQLFGRLDGVFEFERSGTVSSVRPEPSPRELEKLVKNSIGMELVLIPAGEFMMGTPDREAERERDEGPQHRVRITKPFYMGKHEVTQQEYERLMGMNPSSPQTRELPEGEDAKLDPRRFPVDSVCWYDAVDFCNKLSEAEGLPAAYTLADVRRENGRLLRADVTLNGGSGYRLPTEAEWEYACRAGTSTPFHFGASSNGSQANVSGDLPYGTKTEGPDLSRPAMVGSYPGNAFGVCDMHGNVWEWCQDWYGEDYYAGSPTDDPQGPATGRFRVIRGGSWFESVGVTRAGKRYSLIAINRYSSLYGFRIVRNP